MTEKEIIVTITPVMPVINVTNVIGATIQITQEAAPEIKIIQPVIPIIEVSSLGARGLKGDKGEPGASGSDQSYEAGESLVSHIPIALVGGLAYKMDYLNPLHQFAFVGFSKTSAVQGGYVTIETVKIELQNWGLLPNQTYLAGAEGGLITVNNTPNSFSKIVGFAQSSTSMLIVKDYTSINKN